MTAPAHTRVCYRHPDRVAGISCQRCERPICPSCMHQASVGFHCPDCARAGAQQVIRGPVVSKPLVTQALIGINLAIFVLGIVVGGGAGVTGRAGGLIADGALFGPLVPDEPWRLVTSGFLHAGLLHVGLNMWVLWVLGSFMEPALGRARFLTIYGAALAAGALGVVLLDPEAVTVGASGAIYGLMGGAVIIARQARVDLMRSGLIPTLGLNLLLTFAIPGISIGGHLGGLVGGFIVGALVVFIPRSLGPSGRWVAVVVGAAVGVAFLAAAYGLMVADYGALELTR